MAGQDVRAGPDGWTAGRGRAEDESDGRAPDNPQRSAPDNPERNTPALISPLRRCRIKDIIRHHKKRGRGVVHGRGRMTRSRCCRRPSSAGRRARAGRPRRPRAAPPRGRRARHRPRRRPRRRVRLRRLLQGEDRQPEHPEGLQARRGPVPRMVPAPRAGAPPGDVVPRRRLRRASPRRQGRPPARGPQQEAAPGRPAALLRQPADVPRRRHQPRLQRPRPAGTPPARARRPPSTTSRSATSSTPSARATSSGSATRRCS